jgi:hypothetical protein
MPATIRKRIKKRKTLKMSKKGKLANYDPSAKYLLNKYLLIRRSMMPRSMAMRPMSMRPMQMVMRPMVKHNGPLKLSKLLSNPRRSMTESAFMRLNRSSKTKGKAKRRHSHRR